MPCCLTGNGAVNMVTVPLQSRGQLKHINAQAEISQSYENVSRGFGTIGAKILFWHLTRDNSLAMWDRG